MVPVACTEKAKAGESRFGGWENKYPNQRDKANQTCTAHNKDFCTPPSGGALSGGQKISEAKGSRERVTLSYSAAS